MMKEDFEASTAALPEGVSWGDPLTPEIARGIMAAGTIPAGCMIVPISPTDEMVEVAQKVWFAPNQCADPTMHVWDAMIAAAPGITRNMDGLVGGFEGDVLPGTFDSADDLISALREPPTCWCETCRPITLNDMRMVLCPTCGNKRCPHATDHRNDCTDSNETGQPGSSYADCTARKSAEGGV